jgi:hypothetical protein
MKNFTINEPFFPLFKTAMEKSDVRTQLACGKIKGKLEAYAKSLGSQPDDLRLLDVCTASGETHPKLLQFINGLPRKKGQTEQRYKKNKEENTSNSRRAVRAVIKLLAGDVGEQPDGEAGATFLVGRPEEPALAEIYDLLPKEQTSPGVNMATLSESGVILFLACKEVFGQNPCSSAKEFFTKHRGGVVKIIYRDCPPEKISGLLALKGSLAQRLGAVVPSCIREAIPLDEFPQPLLEEMRVYKGVIEGKLKEGVIVQAASVDIVLKGKLSPATYKKVVWSIGKLLAMSDYPKNLSIRDILATTISRTDTEVKVTYHNKFLTPYREAERLRESCFKRAGYDSENFANLLTSLKSVAFYNGIFEHHEIINAAFKLHPDRETKEGRKAVKKLSLDRKAIDSWIDNNYPEYERILKKELFKRDKNQRGYKDSDTYMRFVLYYCQSVFLKVTGYRQKQLRNCILGVNIKVTPTSVELFYPGEQTKTGTPLRLHVELKSSNKTHGRLIRVLSLFARHALPYIQQNLAPWETGDREENRMRDPRGQFFFCMSRGGTFRRFHVRNHTGFTLWFKRASREFLKDPKLSREAILMAHPHFLCGVAMDTTIYDHGASTETAGRLHGRSERTINEHYKDRHAVLDASRDVILLNAQMAQVDAQIEGGSNQELEKLKKEHAERERRHQDELREARQEAKEARAETKEVQAELTAANLKITGLEQQLDEMQSVSSARHDEVMEALRGKNKKRAA